MKSLLKVYIQKILENNNDRIKIYESIIKSLILNINYLNILLLSILIK